MYDSRTDQPRNGVHWLRESRLSNRKMHDGSTDVLYRHIHQIPLVELDLPQQTIAPMSVRCYVCRSYMFVSQDNEFTTPSGETRMACDRCYQQQLNIALSLNHDMREEALTDRCEYGCKILSCTGCLVQAVQHSKIYGCEDQLVLLYGNPWVAHKTPYKRVTKPQPKPRPKPRPRTNNNYINVRELMMPSTYTPKRHRGK